MTPAEKRERIIRALVGSSWNVSEAARSLNVWRQALQRDIREHGGIEALHVACNRLLDVAPATCVAHATLRECITSGGCNTKYGAALTYTGAAPMFSHVSGTTVEAEPVKTFKSTTLPLDREEWLFLRRRAEREADAGGDSSLRGAIKSLIRAEMQKEQGE